MPYTIYNGWNIIPMPATPGFKEVSFSANDSVGVVQSPFTMQAQVQAWPGADYWEVEVSLPPMSRKTAQPWIAFLMALRGKANVFQLGDPLGKTPMGNPAQGGPATLGTHLATATLLNTNGWWPNAQNVLMVGDYIQIGYYLHVVVGSNVNAASTGEAQIEIWPSLRVAIAEGQPIITSNCTGLFRLADNKRTWSATESKLTGISFKAVEAR